MLQGPLEQTALAMRADALVMLAAALGAALASLGGLGPLPTRLAPSGVFLTTGVAVPGAALA
eukprot:11144154-Alexandrium_andersonii.AAC.1